MIICKKITIFREGEWDGFIFNTDHRKKEFKKQDYHGTYDTLQGSGEQLCQ